MRCNKCKKYGSYRAFSTFRQKNGTVRRRGVCRICRQKQTSKNFKEMKLYRKMYNKRTKSKRSIESIERRKIAREYVSAIKERSRCCDCGGIFPAVAMDFDHIKGKNKSIASMVSQAYKLDLIIEEMQLCEIVCACCHRVRTAKRKQNIGRKK